MPPKPTWATVPRSGTSVMRRVSPSMSRSTARSTGAAVKTPTRNILVAVCLAAIPLAGCNGVDKKAEAATPAPGGEGGGGGPRGKKSSAKGEYEGLLTGKVE